MQSFAKKCSRDEPSGIALGTCIRAETLLAVRFGAELHLNWRRGGAIDRLQVLSGKCPSEELSRCDTIGCQASGEATLDRQRVSAVDRELVLPGTSPLEVRLGRALGLRNSRMLGSQAELHLNWQRGGAIDRLQVLSGKCPTEKHSGYDTSCCQVLGGATA